MKKSALILICLLTSSAVFSKTDIRPLADALKVWDFADSEGLEAKGEVRAGVPLSEAERFDSLARGGNGLVAELNGGYFVTEPDFDLTGQPMTLLVRARDRSGQWTGTLLSEKPNKDSYINILYGAKIMPGPSANGLWTESPYGFREEQRIQDFSSIEFRWRTTPLKERAIPAALDPNSVYDIPRAFVRQLDRQNKKHEIMEGLLHVAAPVELVGPSQWHDILVRFNGPNLELFIDGVLMDEEFPHGPLRMFPGPLFIGGNDDAKQRFKGEVDHIAIWDRALNDLEIKRLSGGAEHIAERKIEIEGPLNPNKQYWRPAGYNQFVGDPMVFFHDGEYHFFYLSDRRHSAQKWRMGGHRWEHLSTRDLVNWKHYPAALEITDPRENDLGTGQFIIHDGIWYLYWINHGRRMPWKDAPDHLRADNIYLATSKDGIHFEKRLDEPWIELDYKSGGDVNPLVWKAATGDRFYMYCNSKEKRGEPNLPYLFKSEDLKNWTRVPSPNFADKLPKGSNICLSHHEWNGWYYVHCGPRYWKSRRPIEDAEMVAHDDQALDLGVPEWAPFHNNRRIGAGFALGLGYGGEAVFRELVQFPDGTLGTKWPEEMIPASGKPIAGIPASVLLNADQKITSRTLTDIPQNIRIRAKVTPGPGASGFGLNVRAARGQLPNGPTVWIEPAKGHVECRASENTDHDGNRNLQTKVIKNMTGLDQAFHIDIIVKDDFMDVCIDNRRTIFQRLRDDQGDIQLGENLVFVTEKGSVEFTDIEIRPLLNIHSDQ